MGFSDFVYPVFLYCGIPLLVIWGLRKLGSRWLAKHWGQVDLRSVDLHGKVAVITGAGSGVGFETAVALADRGATVVISGRTMKKAKRVVEAIRNRTFLGQLVPFSLELSSLVSVKSFVDSVEKQFSKVDFLFNNAGVLHPVTNRQVSQDDFELHFAVNHLAHFYLTSLLLPLLKKSGDSRVIVVSSMNHQGVQINFNDLMFNSTPTTESPMQKNPLYMQSKYANVLFAHHLRRKLLAAKIRGVKVFVCCPGLVATKISRNLELPFLANLLSPMLSFLFKTPLQGAQTPLYCALEADEEEAWRCILYRHCKPWNPNDSSYPEDYIIPPPPVPSTYADEDAERLWIESERLCCAQFSVN